MLIHRKAESLYQVSRAPGALTHAGSNMNETLDSEVAQAGSLCHFGKFHEKDTLGIEPNTRMDIEDSGEFSGESAKIDSSSPRTSVIGIYLTQ